MDARAALPDVPLLLGCARPPGRTKVEIDSYAVMAGLNGLAHPSDGMVELAVRLERDVRVTPACCSIAIGDEVMAIESRRRRSASRHPESHRTRAHEAPDFCCGRFARRHQGSDGRPARSRGRLL